MGFVALSLILFWMGMGVVQIYMMRNLDDQQLAIDMPLCWGHVVCAIRHAEVSQIKEGNKMVADLACAAQYLEDGTVTHFPDEYEGMRIDGDIEQLMAISDVCLKPCNNAFIRRYGMDSTGCGQRDDRYYLVDPGQGPSLRRWLKLRELREAHEMMLQRTFVMGMIAWVILFWLGKPFQLYAQRTNTG